MPLVALFLVIVAAVMVLVIDVARVYIAQQQLQNAVNASALAASLALPSSVNALAQADDFGGASGERNALYGYDVSAAMPSVTFECLSHGADYTAGTPPKCQADSSGDSCQPAGANPVPGGATTCNAVVVSERATVTSIFGGLFFPKGWGVSASAIAASRGGASKPLNVEVVIDTTGSMGSTSCAEGVTGISNPPYSPNNEDCAKSGVRALLETLYPCTSTCSGTPTANQGGANWSNPEDEVGIIPVPANTASLAPYEITCSSSVPNSSNTEYPPWTDPTATGAVPAGDNQAGYEAVGLSSDYRNSDATGVTDANLSTTSDLVDSVYWNQCSNSNYPGGDYYGLKQIGGQGSYLAGAISEAEYLLLQASAARPGSSNDLVIESDGEMSKSPVDFSTGSSTSPCKDAYEAAAAAKAALITVYTIQFDPAATGSTYPCGPDNAATDAQSKPNDSATADASPTTTYDNAIWLMENMATGTTAPFYYDDPGNGSGPSIDADFSAVGVDITEPRLIANCTNAPPAC
jgi:hypothetical protein